MGGEEGGPGSPNLNSPKSCLFPFDLSDSVVLDSLSSSFLSSTLPDSILAIMVLNPCSLPSLASFLRIVNCLLPFIRFAYAAVLMLGVVPVDAFVPFTSSVFVHGFVFTSVFAHLCLCAWTRRISRTFTSRSGLRLLGVGHSEDEGLASRTSFNSRLYSFKDSEVVSRDSSVDVVVGVSFSFASVVVGGSMSLVLFIIVQIQTGRTVHRIDRTDRHRQNQAPLYS